MGWSVKKDSSLAVGGENGAQVGGGKLFKPRQTKDDDRQTFRLIFGLPGVRGKGGPKRRLMGEHLERTRRETPETFLKRSPREEWC